MYERVRERGYASLTAFAEARPTASLVELAEELGEDDLRGCRCSAGCVAEAERRHKRHALCARMCLCASSERFPNGWPAVLDDANRLEVAMALGLVDCFHPRNP